MLRIADLFGGIGGFRRGAELCYGKENVKGALYCELDKHAARTYHAYWPRQEGELYSQDIRALTQDPEYLASEVPDLDLVCAGFPCQPFSAMGNQRGFEDERGNLFFEIIKLLKVKRPNAVVLENVSRLTTLHEGAYLRAILGELRALGYTVGYSLLNSADYGVPQVRRRVFIVGVLNPTPAQSARLNAPNLPHRVPFYVPPGFKPYPTVFHALEREVAAKYYLSERIKPTIMSHGTGGWSAKPEINRLIARPLTKTMHKMHRASQDNYYSNSFIHGELTQHPEQGYQVTLSAEGDHAVRRLTPLEALRLQGFDDALFEAARAVGVSDTQLYMQAGNAVTTTAAASVFKYYLTLEV